MKAWRWRLLRFAVRLYVRDWGSPESGEMRIEWDHDRGYFMAWGHGRRGDVESRGS